MKGIIAHYVFRGMVIANPDKNNKGSFATKQSALGHTALILEDEHRLAAAHPTPRVSTRFIVSQVSDCHGSAR